MSSYQTFSKAKTEHFSTFVASDLIFGRKIERGTRQKVENKIPSSPLFFFSNRILLCFSTFPYSQFFIIYS